MMSFGEFGAAPEAGEEIVVRLSWWDRVIDRLLPDPTVKYEREVLLQIARRYKMKNDRLQRAEEARVLVEAVKAAEIEAKYKLIATFRFDLQLNDKSATAIWSLVDDGERREVRFRSIVARDDRRTIGIDASTIADLNSFIRNQFIWTGYIQPWLEGTLSTDQLRREILVELQFVGESE